MGAPACPRIDARNRRRLEARAWQDDETKIKETNGAGCIVPGADQRHETGMPLRADRLSVPVCVEPKTK